MKIEIIKIAICGGCNQEMEEKEDDGVVWLSCRDCGRTFSII